MAGPSSRAGGCWVSPRGAIRLPRPRPAPTGSSTGSTFRVPRCGAISAGGHCRFGDAAGKGVSPPPLRAPPRYFRQDEGQPSGARQRGGEGGGSGLVRQGGLREALPRPAKRDDAGPVAARHDHLGTAAAIADAAGNEILTDPVVRITGRAGDFGERRIAPGKDPDGLREVRAVDEGDVHGPVAVEIGRTDGGEPAVGPADPVRRRDEAVEPVDREAGAEVAVALDDDHVGPRVAVEVGETRRDILENALLGQDEAHPPALGGVEGKRAIFDSVAEYAMGVARRRVVVAGGGNALSGGGRGREGEKECRREAHQICFSGIWTTRPSRASDTLSWQVRRERAGSGW